MPRWQLQAFVAGIAHTMAILGCWRPDEIWGLVGCKERTREGNDYSEDMGDAYCLTAMERTTKC
jgi:hypothetical protein